MKNKYEKSLLDSAKEAAAWFGKFKNPNDEKALIHAKLIAAIFLYENGDGVS